MAEVYRRQVDIGDVILAMGRQRVIIEMANHGQLDAESAMDLYIRTTRPDVVAADRVALEEVEFGPDSPSGQLGTLFLKLAGTKQEEF